MEGVLENKVNLEDSVWMFFNGDLTSYVNLPFLAFALVLCKIYSPCADIYSRVVTFT